MQLPSLAAFALLAILAFQLAPVQGFEDGGGELSPRMQFELEALLEQYGDEALLQPDMLVESLLHESRVRRYRPEGEPVRVSSPLPEVEPEDLILRVVDAAGRPASNVGSSAMLEFPHRERPLFVKLGRTDRDGILVWKGGGDIVRDRFAEAEELGFLSAGGSPVALEALDHNGQIPLNRRPKFLRAAPVPGDVIELRAPHAGMVRLGIDGEQAARHHGVAFELEVVHSTSPDEVSWSITGEHFPIDVPSGSPLVIHNVPEGSVFRVRIKGVGLDHWGEEFYFLGPRRPGQVVEVELPAELLPLDDLRTFRGRALDRSGVPLANQRIIVAPIDDRAYLPGDAVDIRTDAEGNWAYHTTRPSHNRPGFSPRRLGVYLEEPMAVFSRTRMVCFIGGYAHEYFGRHKPFAYSREVDWSARDTDVGDLVFDGVSATEWPAATEPRTFTYRGVLRAENGQQVSGALARQIDEWTMMHPFGSEPLGFSDRNGRFEVEVTLPQGEVPRLRFKHPQFGEFEHRGFPRGELEGVLAPPDERSR